MVRPTACVSPPASSALPCRPLRYAVPAPASCSVLASSSPGRAFTWLAPSYGLVSSATPPLPPYPSPSPQLLFVTLLPASPTYLVFAWYLFSGIVVFHLPPKPVVLTCLFQGPGHRCLVPASCGYFLMHVQLMTQRACALRSFPLCGSE